MKKWGIFELDNEIHVIPCDVDGIHPAKNHIVSKLCSCQPELLKPDKKGDKPIYSHNEFQ